MLYFKRNKDFLNKDGIVPLNEIQINQTMSGYNKELVSDEAQMGQKFIKSSGYLKLLSMHETQAWRRYYI